jgi:hypothetical protein
MRKWLIGAGIAVVAIGLVVGGAAFAASNAAAASQQAADYSHLPLMGGRMGALQQAGSGMMGVGGKLHDYILQALAQSLNLSQDELQTKLAGGQGLVAIAEQQGVSKEELPSVLKEAWSNALLTAVDAGDLTQAQADWMREHAAQLRAFAGRRMGGGRGARGALGPMGG